jgi:hypothetical protein
MDEDIVFTIRSPSRSARPVLEVHEKTAEVEEAPDRFHIDEEVEVAGGVRLVPRLLIRRF